MYTLKKHPASIIKYPASSIQHIIKHLKFMRQLLAILFICSSYVTLSAQQPAQYSLYMLNKFNWNPAYAGLDNSLSINGVYRKQWSGLEGSPETQSLNAHLPVYILGGGMGIQVENDVLGPEHWTSANLAYSYQLDLGGKILSLGVSGGIVQREINGRLIRTPEGSYNSGEREHNDPSLPFDLESAITPTFNAGVYFQSEKLEAGLAMRHLNEATAEFGTFQLSLVRNYFFTLNSHFELGRIFSIHPSVMVQSDATQTQIDFSMLIQYDEKFFAGGSVRGYNTNSLDAAALLMGYQLSEKLSVAYAYDFTLSALQNVSNGSHEIVVNYNLNQSIGKGRPPKIIYNPRSL